MQVLGSLVGWGLVVWVVVVPWVRTQRVPRALAVVMLPLVFRTLGATTLSDQVVRPTLDLGFATHVAIGDGVTVVLAVIAIVLLAREHRAAIAVAWIANLIGLADLLFNVGNGVRVGAAHHVGAQWYVLAFVVPGMAVIHATALWILASRARAARV